MSLLRIFGFKSHNSRILNTFSGNVYKFKSLRRSSSSLQVNGITLDEAEANILLRKHKNNVPVIRSLLKEFQQNPENEKIQKRIEFEIKKFPNETHNRIINYGEEGREIYNNLSTSTKSKSFSDVCKFFNLLRMEHLGHFTGHKSYYLMGDIATLEQSVIRYTISFLKENNFRLISVPDVLPNYIINGCGMQTEGDRTQVYKIDSGECLSGTSEMALAGLFSDQVVNEDDLPLKVAAVSRCFRAETSGLNEEKGIYRVHQFTKVEMFALCSENTSETLLESFRDAEVSLYEQLNLKFRVIDMPPVELGASAFQKYDIEAWMPGREMWGEISSCSNCTDYQSKRLNIRYRTKNGELRYVHTVNGTAAAIPRLLIALIESNKIENEEICIPEQLGKPIKRNMTVNSAEFLAQSQVLRECKVAKRKVENSCRMSGEARDSRIEEMASLSPLNSSTLLVYMEKKLIDTEYTKVMTTYFHKIKGISKNVPNIERQIITDELLLEYNWDGRCDKQALGSLKIFDKILRGCREYDTGVRKAVELSHHRMTQKKYSKKLKRSM